METSMMEEDGPISRVSVEEVGHSVCEDSEVSLVAEELLSLTVEGGDELDKGDMEADGKDPREIARKYQLDLCGRAMKENIVVVLETGCGKTHIAVMLIHEMGSLIRKPQKDICVFLAPTVALVQQQAKVIQESTDFKVGLYCGNNKYLMNRQVWEKEMETCEVFVMTPQLLLYSLSHCFIRMEQIALLIFDECHYAQFESNHPYAEIMKVFYKSEVVKLPRVFGMTASPKLGKGTSIDTLEILLHSKVISVDNREELEEFVVTPEVKIYYYNDSSIDISCSHTIYREKLDEVRLNCVSSLKMKGYNHESVNNMKKMLLRLHNNLLFCLQSLGVYGAYRACSMLMEGDQSERSKMIEAEEDDNSSSLCNKYLTQAASFLVMENGEGPIAADSSIEGVPKDPFFSRKLLRLVEILSDFRIQRDMKCIIFVNRIVTARSLACILQCLSILSSWRCGFLIGVHTGSGNTSRRNMYAILEKFRSGKLNLLVATKVGEEGLDIQTCCLVVRFDLPETMCSYVQSRGRARMAHSEYIILVDRSNTKEMNLIEKFMKEEKEMNLEIASRTSSSTFADFDEKAYKVASTGATVSCASSVSLLYRYCSKLPRDEYFIPELKLFYFNDTNGTVCSIMFPSNAPIRQVVGSPQISREEAKKEACLKACKELHELGALTDYLLPEEDKENDELNDFPDSEISNDPMSRWELHEMLVPALLKESWSSSDMFVYLNSYYIKFIPSPDDREYKRIGLFLKSPLPKEVEKIKTNLCLSHGRSVTAEFFTFGLTKFDQNEILEAQRFQKLLLKAILDRSELVADFVSIDNDEFTNTDLLSLYMLLPVVLSKYEDTMTIDWSLVRRSLSSPMFQTPTDPMNKVNFSLNNNHLQFVDGPYSKDDVVNSLVYVPCKKLFFLVADVVSDKDAFSFYKNSLTHIQHYKKKFRLDLSYPCQPLLKAKQLFCPDNLLRKGGSSVIRKKEEHFVEFPAEVCRLKILGFSKDLASSMSLLPSIMHRLENFLVAIELKQRLSSSFPEGAEVSATRVLEALTTEKCGENFSLERLEVLGDAFLKFAVGRHLFLRHQLLDEGQLTRKRSNIVKNSNLLKLATMKNLQVYIRDQPFEPCQHFTLGRPCPITCNKDTEYMLHSDKFRPGYHLNDVKCSKGHHWLYKKTISDVIESLVGAFIVDCGFKAATAFLKWLGIQLDFEPSQVSQIYQESTMFTPFMDHTKITSIETSLGYQFQYQGLLVQAFIHPSYNNPLGGCYQRLEFLGDAVLDYLITSYLISVYPTLKPGQLTDLRSFYVNNVAFGRIAIARSFQEFILCDCPSLIVAMNNYVNFIRTSSMEKNHAEEGPNCPKALGDLVESCIGAVLLDTGFDLNCVWKIVLSIMEPVTSSTRLCINQVREFVELCQFHHWDLQFSSVKANGRYVVEAKVVDGNNILETASIINFSKKAGERILSEQLFLKLKAKGFKCKSQSLEEFLKTAHKLEPRLIGNDEAPIKVTSPNDIPKLEEAPHNHFNQTMHSKGNGSTSSSNAVQPPSGVLLNKSAVSLLYEICAANCWKPPSFECVSDSGPSHLKQFIFKVIIVIEEFSQIVEVSGEPRSKKKDASHHAAEGAIWYLRKLGY